VYFLCAGQWSGIIATAERADLNRLTVFTNTVTANHVNQLYFPGKQEHKD